MLRSLFRFEDDPNNPVDISNYKNDEIHKLMSERGFERIWDVDEIEKVKEQREETKSESQQQQEEVQPPKGIDADKVKEGIVCCIGSISPL